jgi:hypothetical protein
MQCVGDTGGHLVALVIGQRLSGGARHRKSRDASRGREAPLPCFLPRRTATVRRRYRRGRALLRCRFSDQQSPLPFPLWLRACRGAPRTRHVAVVNDNVPTIPPPLCEHKLAKKAVGSEDRRSSLSFDRVSTFGRGCRRTDQEGWLFRAVKRQPLPLSAPRFGRMHRCRARGPVILMDGQPNLLLPEEAALS